MTTVHIGFGFFEGPSGENTMSIIPFLRQGSSSQPAHFDILLISMSACCCFFCVT